MRKWSPTESDNSEKCETVYQTVVPTVHRQEVLELAHDLPMSGHLGVRKTCNRVLKHFFGLASKETWQSGAKRPHLSIRWQTQPKYSAGPFTSHTSF